MSVQKRHSPSCWAARIPTDVVIPNVIATLRGTASPSQFYVVTGHLDSRVTDVLDFAATLRRR